MQRRALHPAVEDFLAYMEIERAAGPITLQAYRSSLRIFLLFLAERQSVAPEQVDLAVVRRRDIRAFIAYVKNERQNKPKTINYKLTAIRSLYRFLVESEEWHINFNPMEGIGSLREEQRLPVYLTLEEAEQLLESVQTTSRFPERDYLIFLLFLQCGCRFSEVLNITLDSVNLEERAVRLYGKGDKERQVPLTQRTVQAFKEYLRVRKPKVETEALLLNSRGLPLQASSLRRIFKRAVERSPVKKENLTPHKLRHTCLTLLMRAGVDIRTVQEIAGHSNIATTQIYTHVSIETAKREMKKHPLG